MKGGSGRSLAIAATSLVLGASGLALAPEARAQGAEKQTALGAEHYKQHCLLCHGADGQGGQGFPRPIWGKGHDLRKFKTAQGVFEYVQLQMPFDNPQKMTDADKLAVVAFMLVRGGMTMPGELTAGNASKIEVK